MQCFSSIHCMNTEKEFYKMPHNDLISLVEKLYDGMRLLREENNSFRVRLELSEEENNSFRIRLEVSEERCNSFEKEFRSLKEENNSLRKKNKLLKEDVARSKKSRPSQT